MIKRMRNTFRDEAFNELASYEKSKTINQVLCESANDPMLTNPPDSRAYKNAANLKRLKFLNKF